VLYRGKTEKELNNLR
jgi:fused